MRKIRFFYGKIYFVLVVLTWGMLLNKAVFLEKEKLLEEKTGSGQKEKTVREEKAVQQNQRLQLDGPTKIPEAPEHIPDINIRVLLMDSLYESYYHPHVKLLSDGKEESYIHGQMEEDAVTVESREGKITVLSLERAQGNPEYPGKLILRDTSEGILMVNVLPLEEYLKRVVPSEMPASYEEEALKAQAVCARTYALKKIKENDLEKYGADVDDSVNNQVYNNISPQEITSEAVEATKGQVLCQDGEPIEAYYFSTSSGMTSTDEVWGVEQTASYLKSVECEFDAEAPWSQWKVTLPWQRIKEQAQEYYGVDSDVKGLEIVKKSQSGAVTGLRILFTDQAFILENEYEIRSFLSPGDLLILRKDGETAAGGSLLPSAYFTLDVNPGKAVIVRGGGYGHGVGMSQNGANGMAGEGYRYDEILDYFFCDVEICTWDRTFCS